MSTPEATDSAENTLSPMAERVILVDVSRGLDLPSCKELILRKFPFRIGRAQAPAAAPRFRLPRLRAAAPEIVLQQNDLAVHEPEPPFQVSRNHLEIGFRDGRLYVRDVGSTLGTVVNGRRIGGDRKVEAVVIDAPENTIVLGKDNSPWRFRLLLPAAPRRRRMVVADDEAALRATMRRIFQKDFDITEAADGHEALRLCLEERPDVLLLDWMMPGLDGVQVCGALKGNLQTANLPIVMVTAMDFVNDRVTGLEAGADDYVTKPAHARELRARVEAVLTRYRRFRDVHHLTGLPSFAAFRDELDSALEDTTPDVPTAALIQIRVENFGALQAREGAAAADRLVCDVSQLLSETAVAVARTVAGWIGPGHWGLLTRAEEPAGLAAELEAKLTAMLADVDVQAVVWSRPLDGCRNCFDALARD